MNIQNVAPEVKRAFVPKLDALLFCDYSKIEPRFLAYYMARLGDDSMAARFRAGADVYREIISQTLGIAEDKLSEKQYKQGKILFLSQMYGGGIPTLQRQLGLPRDEAKQMIRDFHRALPGLDMVQRSISRRVQDRGYIETLWGRRLRPEQWGEHKMLNKLIQGSAADLMKQSIVRVHHALLEGGWKSHLVASIHDELILDVTSYELPHLAREVPQAMGDERLEEVLPIPVDVEVTYTNWAEKAPYEQEAALV